MRLLSLPPPPPHSRTNGRRSGSRHCPRSGSPGSGHKNKLVRQRRNIPIKMIPYELFNGNINDTCSGTNRKLTREYDTGAVK